MRPMLWVALALGAAPVAHAAQEDALQTPEFSAVCKLGPTVIELNKQLWQAFACDDGKSLAIVANSGNPAAPYVFVVAAMTDNYAIRGDGDGDVPSAHAAGRELLTWDATKIQNVHNEAAKIGPQPSAD